MDLKSDPVFRTYAALRASGVPSPIARSVALSAAAKATVAMCGGPQDLPIVLEKLGVPNAKELTARLSDANLLQAHPKLVTFILHYVYDQHNPWNLDWDCMERHLPPDREPTDDEYDKAVASCQRSTSVSTGVRKSYVRAADEDLRFPLLDCLLSQLPKEEEITYEHVKQAWAICLAEARQK
jgi:hypothetical protein